MTCPITTSVPCQLGWLAPKVSPSVGSRMSSVVHTKSNVQCNAHTSGKHHFFNQHHCYKALFSWWVWHKGEMHFLRCNITTTNFNFGCSMSKSSCQVPWRDRSCTVRIQEMLLVLNIFISIRNVIVLIRNLLWLGYVTNTLDWWKVCKHDLMLRYINP